jgi:hypothetical protein
MVTDADPQPAVGVQSVPIDKVPVLSYPSAVLVQLMEKFSYWYKKLLAGHVNGYTPKP